MRFGSPRLRIAGGLALLALAVVIGVAWAGEGWADRAAYERGLPCPDAHRRRCVVDTTAVVVELRESGGRSRSHDLRMRLEGSLVTEDLADPEEVWYDLRPGMVVDVRLWEGDVTRVSLGDRATETNTSPVVESLEGSAFALICLGGGLSLLASGLDVRGYFFPPPDDRPRSGAERAGHVLVAMGGAAILAVSMFDVFDPYAVAAVAAGGGLAYAVGRRVVQG